jgi:hypothetical protein
MCHRWRRACDPFYNGIVTHIIFILVGCNVILLGCLSLLIYSDLSLLLHLNMMVLLLLSCI